MSGNTDNNSIQYTHYGHSLIAAGVSGGAAGYAGFYFEGLKKRLQSDQKVPKISSGIKTWLRESFRGSGTYALCNIPPTVVQQMTSHYFKEKNLSDSLAGQALEAGVSGALGGIPAAVIGNILLEQQLKSVGPKVALTNLMAQGSTRVFTGMIPLMIREGIFGLCYLKGVNEAGKYADSYFGPAFVFPAQITVGASGSLVSHSFDTVATVMQQKNCGIKKAAVSLWKENKTRAFYKGGAARISLFTTTMLTLNKVQHGVLKFLEENTHASPSSSPQPR